MAENSLSDTVSILSSSSNAIVHVPLRRQLAVLIILISAGLERLAFYSFVGNLTFFFGSTLIQWQFPHTIIAPLLFLGRK
jgi:hypothetical protein